MSAEVSGPFVAELMFARGGTANRRRGLCTVWFDQCSVGAAPRDGSKDAHNHESSSCVVLQIEHDPPEWVKELLCGRV